jgi:hypothetical protein
MADMMVLVEETCIGSKAAAQQQAQARARLAELEKVHVCAHISVWHAACDLEQGTCMRSLGPDHHDSI